MGAKAVLADAAQTKALPTPESYETMRTRGLAYAGQVKAPSEDPNIKRALREIRQRAHAPSSPSLEDQKRILREKGFLPESQPVEASA